MLYPYLRCSVLRLTLLILILLLMSVLMADAAQAAEDGFNYDKTIVLFDAFRDRIFSLQETFTSAASRLFWALCFIALLMRGCELMFTDGGIRDFFGAFVRMLLIIGLFECLLEHGPTIGQDIAESMMQLAGYERRYDPVELLNMTLKLSNGLCDQTAALGIGSDILLSLLVLIIDIALILVTIDYAILYLSIEVLCTLGIIVLGFGAFRYTREIAVNYLRSLFSLALQLMAVVVIVTVGLDVLNEHIVNKLAQQKGIDVIEMLYMLFQVLLFFSLARAIPPLLASLFTAGGPVLNEGRAGFSSTLAIAFAPIMTTLRYLKRRSG